MAVNATTDILTPAGSGIGARLSGVYRALRRWR